MLTVVRDGGRIRPRVSVVKALASALCIGTGGPVGRGILATSVNASVNK
jgi:CIC family chloride channel protein